MHQTKKGNQWHFGMKAHIGVGCRLGAGAHSDRHRRQRSRHEAGGALLHGQEEEAFADAGYTGAEKRPELDDRGVAWHMAIKRSMIKAFPNGYGNARRR